jgi:moderate conductance mechanosensitive channel
MQTFLTDLSRVALVVVLRLIVLVVAAVVGFRLIELSRRAIEKRVVQQADEPSRCARLATLLDACVRTAQLLLVVVVVLMALAVIGINIGPVIAAAGVMGLAVSLGAQSLIKDFIGGILILLEDQFRVGDVIQVGDAAGTVERISLRATYVRDLDGRLWVVSNGDVRTLSNSTRDWSRAVVNLNLGLGADVSRAVTVLEAAMERAAAEPALQGKLLEKPVVEGWSSLTDWSVQVRMKVSTGAGEQWTVARLLRQAALDALREADIPVASPVVGLAGDSRQPA